MAKAKSSTAGGLAKAGAKKVAKKALMSTAAPYIAVAVAIVVAVAAIIIVITSLAGGTVAEVQRIGSVAAAAGGVKSEDEAVIRPIANSYGIPWEILAALPIAEATTGAEPGYNGPYAIKSGTPGISDADAKLLGLAATFIASRMRAQIIAGTMRSGVVYHQDSLTTGASQDRDGTLTYANASPDVAKASAATKAVFVAALVSLPVRNATQDFMGIVFDMAQAWALGKNRGCTGGSGSSGAVDVNVTGSLAGLSAAESKNAGLIYQAAVAAKLGDKGATIGIAVALAESTLQNYANDGTSQDMGYFPEGHRQLNDAERAVAKQSLNFPHDTVGHNLDSIGLFQQRPSANWGSPAELIDPAKSAAIFFTRLVGVAGWDTSSTPWVAGQTVQGSPSSDGAIYQQQYAKAVTIVAALKGSGATGTAPAQPAGLTTALTSAITNPSTGPPATGASSASAGSTSAAMPYPLPATHGATGTEEAVDSGGHVPSGRGVGTITFAKYAALGSDYDNYYITMRWGYVSWNFDGTSSGVDQAQYNWFGAGATPQMVLVTNPRTGKSILAPVLESGPAPWVGVVNGGSHAVDSTGVWANPTKGTPANYKGIVSGFPPKAIAALGAVTGYVGQNGDDLIYQWAPDQNAKPGPTTLIAKADGGTGGTSAGCSPCPATGGVDISGVAVGSIAGLRPDQLANAQAIAKVALSRGLGERGVLIGIMTAITESGLINVNHGDLAGPDSIGLFQQRNSWGPISVRTDPAGAAGLFFDAMVQVPSWQTADPPTVAQSVQRSAFSDGSNYRKQQATAQSYTTSLMTGASGGLAPTSGKPVASTTPSTAASKAAKGTAPATGTVIAAVAPAAGAAGCTSGTGGGAAAGSVVANGPSITFPSGNSDIPQELWGKAFKAPNAAIAKGLAAGISAVGTPYVYGGGGEGSKDINGPDDGCARAGHAENACQGTIGFDCSGLTAYILHMAGFGPIGSNSGAQGAGGTAIPRAQGMAGDLQTYDGHVAMYLGFIGGQDYVLEAPQPGRNVSIRKAYWSNNGIPAPPDMRRFWH